jgi:hypothetical protein
VFKLVVDLPGTPGNILELLVPWQCVQIGGRPTRYTWQCVRTVAGTSGR